MLLELIFPADNQRPVEPVKPVILFSVVVGINTIDSSKKGLFRKHNIMCDPNRSGIAEVKPTASFRRVVGPYDGIIYSITFLLTESSESKDRKISKLFCRQMNIE